MYVLKITMESAYKGFMCDSELLENGISFDDAVKDWRKSFCDVENCNRK